MAAPCPLLGDGITDDTLLAIARFLPTARDLLSLGLTCPRCAAKIIAAGGSDRAAEMLSIVEEAARLWVAGCSQRGWVPRLGIESWLGLMDEVGLLRLPLAFGRTHVDFTLSDWQGDFEFTLSERRSGAVATKTVADGRVTLRSLRRCQTTA